MPTPKTKCAAHRSRDDPVRDGGDMGSFKTPQLMGIDL
jgi:hypothetical protein